MRILRSSYALIPLTLVFIAVMATSATPAQAECFPPSPGGPHPCIKEFGSFTNPNGIAVEESTGDVYVADIATDTVYKFDSQGNPVAFSALHTNALSGAAGSFSFPEEPGTPAAIAVDNSTNPSDPSAGDLYVMDAGHDVIDKFGPTGAYVNQITGFVPAPAPASERELLGLGVEADGDLRVEVSRGTVSSPSVKVFDNSVANSLVRILVPGNGATGESEPEHAEHGFAVGPADDYELFSSCGCMEGLDSNLEPLGRVDSGSADVAVAVDPATGHLYIDEQSSVAEWDTGEMNGQSRPRGGPRGRPDTERGCAHLELRLA